MFKCTRAFGHQKWSKILENGLNGHHIQRFLCQCKPLRQEFIGSKPRQDVPCTDREKDNVDVLIIGAGPAGLSAAIKLRQNAIKAGKDDFRVLVLEKGATIGAHTLSGAVLDPRALNELQPNWQQELQDSDFGRSLTAVNSEKIIWLTKNRQVRLPNPPPLHNAGNYIISLAAFVRWLAEKAEDLGVEIIPEFSGAHLLHNDKGHVIGAATGDIGLDRSQKRQDNIERGFEFHAKLTFLAEGARGSLTKIACKEFNLCKECDPQTFGIGLKEVWQVDSKNWSQGAVYHTMGWPVGNSVYSGAWAYHYGDNLISLGLVIGLDYKNPYLNPYLAFQQMKHHPFYARMLQGGKCIAYGARALNEGGYQSIPRLYFPGGVLVGCSAGFVDVARIKGIHNAMKSGMLAADAACKRLFNCKNDESIQLEEYQEAIYSSWIGRDLKKVRNIRPSFNTRFGMIGGILYSGIDTMLFRSYTPWTFHHSITDSEVTESADKHTKIEYPKSDGKLSFDILTNVSLTGTMHREDEPIHLVDQEPQTRYRSFEKFRGIESRFCPAAVYEWIDDTTVPGGKRFQINSQNCIHCKTCDIKDPLQNIKWTVPEKGGGPSKLSLKLY